MAPRPPSADHPNLPEQIAYVVLFAFIYGFLLTIPLVWIVGGLTRVRIARRQSAAVERYVRDHRALCAELARRPGVYQLQLSAQPDHIRVDGVVEDAETFGVVEQAFNDAWALRQPPYMAMQIRNGQERPQNLGYMAAGIGEAARALIVFALTFFSVVVMIFLMGMSLIVYQRRRHRATRTPDKSSRVNAACT